jgi:hypothetical protein
MKKLFIAIIASTMLLSSCADSKTFRKSDGTEFTANPYGWMSKEEKIPGVEYELCAGNIIWSCILSETIIAPVLLTGVGLYEPVNYNEPKE